MSLYSYQVALNGTSIRALIKKYELLIPKCELHAQMWRNVDLVFMSRFLYSFISALRQHYGLLVSIANTRRLVGSCARSDVGIRWASCGMPLLAQLCHALGHAAAACRIPLISGMWSSFPSIVIYGLLFGILATNILGYNVDLQDHILKKGLY